MLLVIPNFSSTVVRVALMVMLPQAIACKQASTQASTQASKKTHTENTGTTYDSIWLRRSCFAR